MLQRDTLLDGVVVYRSPLLLAAGVPHAFSTRLGGISPAPFDSMNLGNPNGCDIQDDYDRVWMNYRRLQEAVGCAGRELCRVHQVHGATVAITPRTNGTGAPTSRRRHFSACDPAATDAAHDSPTAQSVPFDIHQQADAIVTDDPNRVASVRVADCVPILLATEDGRCVAAVHAGWRGVIADIVPAALAAMREIAPGRRMLAAIGPCIGFDAFEVGPEVLDAFRGRFGPATPIAAGLNGKGRVDLRQAVWAQCLNAGLSDSCVERTDRCTHRDRDEFFSHRREQGVTGRMAAIIAPGG